MNKIHESISFNMTKKMAMELINFNNLKKELDKLKELYKLDKSENTLFQIQKIETKLNISRNLFIKEFQINNEKEIIEYLKLRNQK